MNALDLTYLPSPLSPAQSLQLRRLSLLSRAAVLGLLDCLAGTGGATAVRCTAAAGWAGRNWAATDPRIPESIVRLILELPFAQWLDDPRVTNPVVPVSVPAEDVFRRRLQVKAVVVAAMANAAQGTIATEPSRVGNSEPQSKQPKQAQRGPEPPRLASELPDDLNAFECVKCRQKTTGPVCTAFDGVGTMCVDCSLDHSEARGKK